MRGSDHREKSVPHERPPRVRRRRARRARLVFALADVFGVAGARSRELPRPSPADGRRTRHRARGRRRRRTPRRGRRARHRRRVAAGPRCSCSSPSSASGCSASRRPARRRRRARVPRPLRARSRRAASRPGSASLRVGRRSRSCSPPAAHADTGIQPFVDAALIALAANLANLLRPCPGPHHEVRDALLRADRVRLWDRRDRCRDCGRRGRGPRPAARTTSASI